MPLGRPEVPLDSDASGPFLPWLVAFMVYLAALALTSAIAMHKIAVHWDHGLSGNVTVQVPSSGEIAAAAAPGQDVGKVLAVLAASPAVADVRVLERDEIARLLEPWLGEAVDEQDLPLPTLIAVTLNPQAGSDLAELSRRLRQAVPGTELDDHQRWLGRLVDLARLIELIATLVVVLVVLAAVITVVFVTRTGLLIHRQVIEILHLIGAQDSYVARQFQAHAFRLGAFGGLVGLLLAVVTIGLLGALLGRVQSGLLPDLSLSPGDWAMLASVPLVTTGVAMVTARITVLRNLARLP